MTAEIASPRVRRLPKFLKIGLVSEETSLSVAQIKKLAALGQFPKPVPLSEHRSAWIGEEIEAWIAQRIASRKVA